MEICFGRCSDPDTDDDDEKGENYIIALSNNNKMNYPTLELQREN